MILEVLVKLRYDTRYGTATCHDPYTDELILEFHSHEEELVHIILDHFEMEQLKKDNPEL